MLQTGTSKDRQYDQGVVFLDFKLITRDERINCAYSLNMALENFVVNHN